MSRFHERTMGVYFDDLDPYRILHNARYLLLFERTLGSFWRETSAGRLQAPDQPHGFHLVRANSVEYHFPVKGVCEVRVRVWIEHLGRTSMRYAFCMMPIDEDRNHATGTRVIVHVDPDTWRPVPWSDSFRKKVRPWVFTEEDK